MHFTHKRIARALGAITLLLAGCAPLQPPAAPAVTPAAPAEATPVMETPGTPPTAPITTTTTATTTGAAPTVQSGLVLSAPVTMTITGPISPAHGIVGPVGEPQIHGDAAAPAHGTAATGSAVTENGATAP